MRPKSWSIEICSASKLGRSNGSVASIAACAASKKKTEVAGGA
jgi:hypothetical protein